MNQQLESAVSYFKTIALDLLDPIECWVAGGAVRDYFTVGHITSDVDVFFKNKTDFDAAFSKLSEIQKPSYSDDRIANFYIQKRKIQLIQSHFFDSPEESIKSFDFTVCCAAVDRNQVYTHETFFIDLSRRRLVINALPYPLSTLERLQKYIKRGYTICNGGLLELARGIQGLELDNDSEKNEENNTLMFYPNKQPRFIRID
jgi:tRNA nucleotidyltransferase/poly(A) polymerase